MSDNHAAHDDSLRMRLAAGACVEPIVECIRRMRAGGLADNEIAGLLRHAAEELDEAHKKQT
jgi:cellobiose-specific phosphotransferase system component IIA